MAERILKFKPTEKQLKFLEMKNLYCGYGGARGGGKSWVIRFKAALLANRFGAEDEYREGIRICIVRRTLVDVRNNHIIPMRNMLRGLAKFNQAERTFYFPNGATIHFEYYDNDGDDEHFQGIEFDVIFIDEATQMKEEWLEKIAASCRGVNNFPKRVYFTCNPGGQGHNYIKRIFIDRVYKDDEDPDDYAFVQAKVTDNKVLMETNPAYIRFLKHLPPKLRRAWLDGDFNVYEGQFFETFTNDPDHYNDLRWTHVINPIKIRPHWPIYRSFDWGFNKPFSVGWYTVTDESTFPQGSVVIRIAELYGVQKSGNESLPDQGVKWTPEKVFATIQQIENEHPYFKGRQVMGVADPAIWDAQLGKSIAETATHYGIYFEPGDHARIPGWMQCQYRLQFDEDGYPKFYVFNTCKEFIRTIPTLQYSERVPEDLDTKQEDHIADEWRYLLMKFLITPVIEQEQYQPKFGADPLGTVKSR